MSDHNVAALHEAIAAAVPQRNCIVWRGRRLSWADVTDRSRRLAAVLRVAGLGLATAAAGWSRAEVATGTSFGGPGPGGSVAGRSPGGSRPGGTAGGGVAATAPWESPHDHVALYLHNGNEYLEGMLGAWKARCAPVNVNYRYVAGELAYLLRDSRAAAIVYHGYVAETLAAALTDLRPGLRLLLQVDDGSGAPLLPGALDYEEALAAADPAPPVDLSPDDRYILYTGGTTGMPKGVLWRQGDFLATCLGVDGSTDDLVAAARNRTDLRVLPSAPFMHGAAHWNAISAWMSGGTIVIQDDPTRLVPADVLGTCERERVSGLQVVGDAFARPLLDELESGTYDLSALRRVLSGGATLSPSVKARLTDLLPRLQIVDVLGSSETGRQAVAQTVAGQAGGPDPGASHSGPPRHAAPGGSANAGDGPSPFVPSADAVVLSEDRTRRLSPGDGEVGWLAQRGRVPLGYLGDPDKTRATFPVIDGVRHAVSGDRVRLLADGRIAFLGRESVTINTGGEKVFAEEVETVLTAHPAVADALVVGRSHSRWGQEVVAVVSSRDPASAPSADTLRAHCRAQLAAYKVPKAFLWVDQVRRSPAGKADYPWAHEVADAGGASDVTGEDHEQR